MKAYLASPLGFSEVGRQFYHDKLVPLVKACGHDVLDPWTLTDQALIDRVLALPYGPERKQAWTNLNKIVGENNRKAIDQSDSIVAVLDGTDVDSGTSAEIGYGYGKGKRIYGYRGDFRLAADNEGSIVNLQVEYFIRASGGDIASDLAQLKSLLS